MIILVYEIHDKMVIGYTKPTFSSGFDHEILKFLLFFQMFSKDWLDKIK